MICNVCDEKTTMTIEGDCPSCAYSALHAKYSEVIQHSANLWVRSEKAEARLIALTAANKRMREALKSIAASWPAEGESACNFAAEISDIARQALKEAE